MRNIKSVAFIARHRCPAVGLQIATKLQEPRSSSARPRSRHRAAGRHQPRHPSGRDRTVDPLNDPKGVLANRSVYFDYDSYVVRDDGKPVVENHSAT
jgi:peptidoglycan-associated lipoprotein